MFTLVIVAELMVMGLIMASGTAFYDFWQWLSLLSLYVQWIAVGSAYVLCALGPFLNRHGNLACSVGVLVIVLLVTALLSEAAWQLIQATGRTELAPLDGHMGMLLRPLIIAAIGVLLLLRYFYLQHAWKQQVRAEAGARMQSLQSRIRPHFLFNSMNTVANLTRTNPPLAETLLHDMADLFRSSLGDASKSSTLIDELRLAKQYLNIEKQRLGDRLVVHWDVSKEIPRDALMPALILQPLLENAVYHGIEPAEEQGHILT
ncbi:MAG: histidine kinase [gamma proteobacterium symbiont of Bathyaustriella thionipta]|nr:histidine kinase [gamma proteobacterium symbiont of Bathyaustriella thionipta]